MYAMCPECQEMKLTRKLLPVHGVLVFRATMDLRSLSSSGDLPMPPPGTSVAFNPATVRQTFLARSPTTQHEAMDVL